MEKQLFVTKALTEYSTKDLEGAGALRWYNNKLYQWVENDGAVAARAGGPACYDATNADDDDFLGKCLPDCAAEDLALFAGIWMAAVPADSFGWILVLGRYPNARIAVASGGASAIGDQYLASTYTTTTGTSGVVAFAFVAGLDISVVNSASTVVDLTAVGLKIAPHVIVLEAVATATGITTLTTAKLFDVFVRGLMAH